MQPNQVGAGKEAEHGTGPSTDPSGSLLPAAPEDLASVDPALLQLFDLVLSVTSQGVAYAAPRLIEFIESGKDGLARQHLIGDLETCAHLATFSPQGEAVRECITEALSAFAMRDSSPILKGIAWRAVSIIENRIAHAVPFCDGPASAYARENAVPCTRLAPLWKTASALARTYHTPIGTVPTSLASDALGLLLPDGRIQSAGVVGSLEAEEQAFDPRVISADINPQLVRVAAGKDYYPENGGSLSPLFDLISLIDREVVVPTVGEVGAEVRARYFASLLPGLSAEDWTPILIAVDVLPECLGACLDNILNGFSDLDSRDEVRGCFAEVISASGGPIAFDEVPNDVMAQYIGFGASLGPLRSFEAEVVIVRDDLPRMAADAARKGARATLDDMREFASLRRPRTASSADTPQAELGRVLAAAVRGLSKIADLGATGLFDWVTPLAELENSVRAAMVRISYEPVGALWSDPRMYPFCGGAVTNLPSPDTFLEETFRLEARFGVPHDRIRLRTWLTVGRFIAGDGTRCDRIANVLSAFTAIETRAAVLNALLAAAQGDEFGEAVLRAGEVLPQADFIDLVGKYGELVDTLDRLWARERTELRGAAGAATARHVISYANRTVAGVLTTFEAVGEARGLSQVRSLNASIVFEVGAFAALQSQGQRVRLMDHDRLIVRRLPAGGLDDSKKSRVMALARAGVEYYPHLLQVETLKAVEARVNSTHGLFYELELFADMIACIQVVDDHVDPSAAHLQSLYLSPDARYASIGMAFLRQVICDVSRGTRRIAAEVYAVGPGPGEKGNPNLERYVELGFRIEQQDIDYYPGTGTRFVRITLEPDRVRDWPELLAVPAIERSI